jgi:protein-S-isoprenylcysteine O-methyltransferase Ste14
MIVRLGNWLFRTRDFIFPVVFLTLAVAIKPVIAGGDRFLDGIVDAIGIGVALAGQTLRVLVIGFAYITRGGQNRKVFADSLVQQGVFAHCRNPLYLGNILLLVGLAVVHGSPLFLFLVCTFFVFAYFSIVRAEEEYLARKFGPEYDEYCRRVPRFVPSIAGLRRTLGGLQFDWWKVLRKEYGTSFTWLSGVLALLLWERLSVPGTPVPRETLLLIGTAWTLLAIVYSTVRMLKLRGALGTG